ncbi:hypothetical protein L7Q78_09135 [Achromobacter xylosoxidans]|uniref:hypothetical protein n=1 Tax=Alcaligenes xylosoxydans xylosoxydans TaxID=85698 RepID=UPI001F064422|nr:hypothetical protein [Achromobacter xylosoxidans]MCH1985258.1 hypothetical protein [Achromobacter xylosoxidans]MCH1992932.1 hypothetical protein [Achromobacter xylosoxidans]MCH4573238.1 hypothetical protein [Achromobacter xylosoxidans]MCH4585647.1 hypothetical protein [Achromobacter xylosoxidans]
MNLNILGWAIALGALAAGLGYWRGEANGHERGVLETQAAHDARQVESLADGLGKLRADVVASMELNKDVRTAMTGLEQQNKTSSAELKNAIAKSRPAGAVQCRFDADSMRILGAAADRADALAAGGLAASGTGRAVPAGRAPD